MYFSLMDLQKKWQDHLYDERRYAQNTVDAYCKDLRYYIDFLANYKNSDINIELIKNVDVFDVRAFLASLSGKSVGLRSRARFLSAIKNFYSFCARNEFFENSAVHHVKIPRGHRSIPKDMSVEDAMTSIDSIKNIAKGEWEKMRDVSVLLLLYGSGLRISEALNIKCRDIDLSNRTVIVMGKGGKERLIPILETVAKHIQEYVDACPFIYDSSSWLFYGARGGKLSRNYFAARIKQMRESNDLPSSITAHSFRHSFASHLINKDVCIRVIQELLGHASLSTTQIYANMDHSARYAVYNAHHPRSNKKN